MFHYFAVHSWQMWYNLAIREHAMEQDFGGSNSCIRDSARIVTMNDELFVVRNFTERKSWKKIKFDLSSALSGKSEL